MSNYGLDLYSDRGSGDGEGGVGGGRSSGGAEFSPTQPTVYAQQRGSLIKQSRGYSVKLESGCGDSLAPPGAKVPPVGVTAVGHLKRFYQCHLLLCRTVVPLRVRARFTVPGRVQTHAGTPVPAPISGNHSIASGRVGAIIGQAPRPGFRRVHLQGSEGRFQDRVQTGGTLEIHKPEHGVSAPAPKGRHGVYRERVRPGSHARSVPYNRGTTPPPHQPLRSYLERA